MTHFMDNSFRGCFQALKHHLTTAGTFIRLQFQVSRFFCHNKKIGTSEKENDKIKVARKLIRNYEAIQIMGSLYCKLFTDLKFNVSSIFF